MEARGTKGLLLLLFSFGVGAGAQRLFFSKYIHAGESQQLLEVYNPGCFQVKVSEFAIIVAKDGGLWNYGSSIFLSDNDTDRISPGQTWVIASDDFVSSFTSSIPDAQVRRTITPSTMPRYRSESRIYVKSGTTYGWFTGNDAIALIHKGEIIDAIGAERIPSMSDLTSWSINGVASATADAILVRKARVREGNLGKWFETERGHSSEATEWTHYVFNATNLLLVNVGSHSVEGTQFPCVLDKLICSATGETLGTNVSSTTVVCPPNCHLSPGIVVGTHGTYDARSSICKAAIHANVTKLVSTPGFPEEGSLKEWQFSRAAVEQGIYAESAEPFPVKADIILLAPNGNDAFFNFSDTGGNILNSSWHKLQTHLRSLIGQFMFDETDRTTRVSVVGFSNDIIPTTPQWRNSYRDAAADISTAIETGQGTRGEKVGDALRLVCERLLRYDVSTATSDANTHQSPRPGVNRFLVVYLRHRPNETELALMETYAKCFTDFGFEIFTIGNITTGWGSSFDNPLATASDAHYMFDWKLPIDQGFNSDGLWEFLLGNIWDAQLCWDRALQTSGNKVYISYTGQQMSLEAMKGTKTQCVASYNRTHTTAAPVASPTVAPSLFDAFQLSEELNYTEICVGGSQCNGNGDCIFTEGYCECHGGCFGPGCEYKECPVCHHGGTCDRQTGECLCTQDNAGIVYFGERCLKLDCLNTNGTRCSDRGVCNHNNGVCQCDPGYHGRHCEYVLCSATERDNQCNNQGRCNWQSGVCECYTGYFGKYCEFATCTDDCSNFGVCDVQTGYCSCEHASYQNTDGGGCRFGYCPNNCSGNGDCDFVHRTCRCNEGWILSDCSRPVKVFRVSEN